MPNLAANLKPYLFVLLFLSIALAVITGQSPQQRQSEPSFLTGAARSEFASLDPVDTHVHVFQTGPMFVGMLEQLHLHVLDILVVDDTNKYRTTKDQQREDALKFVASSQGHAHLCTTFDAFKFNDANFSKAAIDDLNRDFEHGAIAVKIWKNVGMEIKNASGQYILPDDPRIEPIYQDIATHHKTLIAHLAEPDTAWGPEEGAPYSGYYRANPQWDMSKKPGIPSKAAILAARDNILAMNPGLRLVGAHLGSMEEDVDQIAARLDRYPNFAVDTAARVMSLVIQPREKVRSFILKYQDRIVYGTDLGFYAGRAEQSAIQEWERHYGLDWRFFATDDKFTYQGHEAEGLKLPHSVLKKLYHDNGVHWIPGVAGEKH